MGTEYGKMVSIIVPVYNVEKYVEQCVDSLLEQTYQSIEILLIDDGSTDRSGEICDKYAGRDGRIRVLHKINGGVSSARNAGIDMSSGEYLIFVDSDDAVHRELVDIYVRVLELGGVPVCSVAHKEEELSDSYLNHWRGGLETADIEHFMRFLYGDYVNPPWNKLYDADIIRKYNIQFEEGKNLGEDFLFNLQYFLHAPKEYNVLRCPLYYYREGRENSLENSYHPQLFELQLEMFGALYDFLNKSGVWNRENEDLYCRLFWDRLYMTINIYKNYAARTNAPETDTKLKQYLNHSVWNDLDKRCRYRGLNALKHLVKKMNLEIWKRR